MARRKADLDDLAEYVLPWARQQKISDGPLAAMLTQLAERLLATDGDGALPPVPTKGIVCRGHWWQTAPEGMRGFQMRWRAMWLHDYSILLEGEEHHGSRNISEYIALVETLQLIDEEQIDVPAVYSASYVATQWVKQRRFDTSQRCPLWIEETAKRFSATEYPRGKVRYWNPEIWGKTPADYPGYDYLQTWDVR